MGGDTLRVDVELRTRGLAVVARFEAPPGITILFGPSGAGKSTVLAILAGLVRPDAGRISLGEEAWFDRARRVDLPPERRAVALVFQRPSLFPHLTALANVEFALPRGLPAAERRRRAEELLAQAKVAHAAGRRPATLSGGESQRVALARALARAPRLLLLDEAFAAMDAPLRAELHALVAGAVRERGIPALQVTHDRLEARAMGRRVVLLEGGRTVATGGVDELS